MRSVLGWALVCAVALVLLQGTCASLLRQPSESGRIDDLDLHPDAVSPSSTFTATAPPIHEPPQAALIEPARLRDVALELRVTARFPKVDGEVLPAPGVTLSVQRHDPSPAAREVFATAVSDEAGLATLRISSAQLESVLALESPLISLRSEGPGLVNRGRLIRLSEESLGVLDLRAEVRAGVMLRGILLGPDGEPCAGVVRTQGSRRHVAADGRFEIGIEREGPCTLFAEGRSELSTFTDVVLDDPFDLGTGSLGPLEIHFDGVYDELRLHVGGPGVLRGRVLDDRGQPAAGVVLDASRVAELAGGSRQSGGTHGESGSAFGKQGHTQRRALTGVDGEYEITGLAGGHYTLRALNFDPTRSHTAELRPTAPLPADGLPRELTFTRPHLAVHVRDHHGHVPESELSALATPPAVQGRSRGRAWPLLPSLLVHPAPGSPQATSLERDTALHLHQLAPGEFTVQVESGSAFDVATFGGAHPPRVQRVMAPSGAARVDVEIPLAEQQALSELSVTVTDLDGAPITDGVRICLLEPTTGLPLTSEDISRFSKHSWPYRQEIPAATYILRVEGSPTRFGPHGGVRSRRQGGAHEQLVTLNPGEHLAVDAPLGPGARLELALEGSANAEDLAAATARLTDTGRAFGDTVELMAERVDLQLVRPRRASSRPLFDRVVYPEAGHSSSRYIPTTLTRQPSLRTRTTSGELTPGRATLVARLPGGRELRRDVELLAGQATHVTLQFD